MNPIEAQRVGMMVAREDGIVVEQNTRAAELLGPGLGTPCWRLVNAAPGAAFLPCNAGCVGRLIRAGNGEAVARRVLVGGRPYELTCAPVAGRAVCIFSALDRRDSPGWKRLTAREVDVLRHVADGLTTSEVGAALGISAATVRAHVEHMRTKFGVSTRAALVAHGFQLGYLA